MEIKDIVCDLRFAKALKTFGVEQLSSVFVFPRIPGTEKHFSDSPTLFSMLNNEFGEPLKDRDTEESKLLFVSTFTAEELLKILPKEIKHNHNSHSCYYLCMGYDGTRRDEFPLAWYEDNDLSGEDEMLVLKSDEKLANTLAKLLLWLLKSRKITLVNGKASEKKKRNQIPEEREVFTKTPRRFYSIKYKCWVTRTKLKQDENWYGCDLINESTGEKIDTIEDRTCAKLKERLLEIINNPKMF